MGSIWLRRLLGVTLAVTAGLVAAAPASADPAVESFTSWDVGLGGPDEVPDPAGMPIRIEVSWWAVQDQPDSADDWSRYDASINAAVAKGMRVLLLITYAPPWASGNHGLSDGLDHWFPTPDWDDEWAAFITRTVQRYGDKVQAYEVWNEPNQASFGNYGTGTDGERLQRYWDLVRLTNSRVKGGCPDCVVLAGGSAMGTRPANQPQVPESQPNPNSPATWLDWAYDHGYGADFDAVAQHPYPTWTRKEGPTASRCGRPDQVLFGPKYLPGKPYQQQCGQLAALHAVSVDHGDPGRKIWGTEWGYPTYSFQGAGHPSLEAIRDFDVEGVHVWRELDYVGPLFLYSYRDRAGSAGHPCGPAVTDPECHYGIVTAAGKPKEPVYSDLLAKVADDTPTRLSTGQSLRKWSALRSPNARYRLWMQGDGNLVLYDTADGNRALWAVTGTNGRRLINQTDGNLVLYRSPDQPIAVWSSSTYGGGKSVLLLQDDGNLVLYNAKGVAVWATGTYRRSARRP